MSINKPNRKEELALKLIEEGVLKINDNGHIWKFKRRRKKSPVYGPMTHPRRIDIEVSNGYLMAYFSTWENGKVKEYFCGAHRIMWIYHNGPIPDGLEVNHKDGNRKNNQLSNLELLTRGENLAYAFKIGLADQRGERSSRAKLTNIQVLEIRRLYKTKKYTQKQIAIKFNVTQGNIGNIITRKRWTHI